ncbi:MAG: PKD domain-containing protein, partial [Thermoanaerobaculia bacterium]|nr:PKD domain-containing protein [Thermoanaerobaculia bacterium]
MPAAGEVTPPVAALGPGIVAWESNRGGNFRIFLRDLAEEEARQLTPDEPGRDHCCALLSPDGGRLVYLSLPAGKAGYEDGRAAGELRLVRLADGATSVVAERARTYAEHRAAVWWGDGELVHIDGEGHTVRLDLASGRRERLTAEPSPEFGWLVDPTGRFATTGDPTFSRYLPESRRIETAPRLGGCQPVFSQDGRFGVWSAGAGGPIARLDLESRVQATLLARHDPRAVDGFGYLYFPMPSRDGAALAYAASAGGHDHFAADYEVFAVATDPATLEPVGPAVRLTRSPAVDRFPDLWLAPLPLGRHAGEAPFPVRLAAPGPGRWRWELGDGAAAEGRQVQHTYASPGLYDVVARSGGEELRGRVVVRAAAGAAAAPPPAGDRWPVAEEGLRLLWPDADATGRGW